MKRKKKYAAQSAWKKRNPWVRLVEFARRRCSDPKHKSHKFYEGIKVNLTGKQAKVLWDRDGAASMKTPSLDRLDPHADYVFWNCRIIEKAINERLPHMTPEARAAVDAEAIYV